MITKGFQGVDMKIITDRAANLSLEEERSLGLTVAPLYIQFPGEEVDSSTIEPDDLYERMEAIKPIIPTTAQPSAGSFSELYEKILQTGEEILSIHLSEGLSGTIQSARLGAQQLLQGKVTIFDSMTLSGGQRFQVLAAVLASRAGWALDKILDLLVEIREQAEVVYSLDTLEYLEHGGRIGRVQSLVSSLLHIKPVIHVDKADGKYSTVGKARTLSKTLQVITDHLQALYPDDPLWVTVLHGRLPEEAEQLLAQIKERLQVEKAEIMRVTPILGVHTGPGIVGAAALPIRLVADLF